MVAPGGLAVRVLMPPVAIHAPPMFWNWLITCIALASLAASQSTMTLRPAPSPAAAAAGGGAVCRGGDDAPLVPPTPAAAVCASHSGGAIFIFVVVRTTGRPRPSTAAVMSWLDE